MEGEERGEVAANRGEQPKQLWANQGPNCVSNQFGSQLPGNQEQSYNGEYHFHFKTPSLSANHRAAKMLETKNNRYYGGWGDSVKTFLTPSEIVW